MSFELGEGQIIANPDFNGEARKRHAVFMLDLLKPGSTMPGDLDPHSGEAVAVQIASDVTPHTIDRLANTAGFIVKRS